MPMDKSLYPSNWDDISRRIRFERAGNRCEWCGAENYQPHPVTGGKVILTVHHIGVDRDDGTPGDRHDKLDCREENLAALCQRCHWSADWDIHFKAAQAAINNKRYQVEAARAAGQRSMFDEI